MTAPVPGEPRRRRKAYDVRVKGWGEISLIVYADSVAEANRIADEERYGPDVEVCDHRYGEVGIDKKRTRRAPTEDRE